MGFYPTGRGFESSPGRQINRLSSAGRDDEAGSSLPNRRPVRHAGRIFDWAIIVLILVNVVAMVVETLPGADQAWLAAVEAFWWGMSVLTTAGGEVAPVTAVGKAASLLTAVLGIALIAVPTGIITAELLEALESGRPRPGPDSKPTNCCDCRR